MLRPKRTARHTYKKKPSPRKKEAYLPVLGVTGGCWCGKPYDHDWEGREEGTPHPREEK